MNPIKTFKVVGHGVDNGEPRIAEIVAQSREIDMKPNPFRPVYITFGAKCEHKKA
jgi:hypothetical protein